MSVRRATADDIGHMVDLGARFNAQAKTIIPYDRDATAHFLNGLVGSPQAGVFVSESGIIGGVLSPAYCNPSWVMAVELFWWASDRQGLRLLGAFEKWAKDMGAQEVRMTTLQAIDGPERILKRRGYAPAEISYQKVI